MKQTVMSWICWVKDSLPLRLTQTEFLSKRFFFTLELVFLGILICQVMVAESVTIKRETYLSIVLDPTYMGPVCLLLHLYFYKNLNLPMEVIVASPSGGMDIEEIAQNHSELLLKENISVDLGITEEQCLKIAKFLKFKDKLMGDVCCQKQNFALFQKF